MPKSQPELDGTLNVSGTLDFNGSGTQQLTTSSVGTISQTNTSHTVNFGLSSYSSSAITVSGNGYIGTGTYNPAGTYLNYGT
jgi:hypothetical protein